MRVILHPGYVTSRTDGDIHYIDEKQLADLYGVDLNDCLVIGVKRAHKIHENTLVKTSLHGNNVHLYPRYDGKYLENKPCIT